MLYYGNSIVTRTAHLYRNNILQVCYLHLQSPYFVFFTACVEMSNHGLVDPDPHVT